MSQNVRTEWETIQGEGSEPEIRLYVAKPGEGRHPPLIVIHEAFGLDEHIQDVTRRFAVEGYLAIAPDLFGLEEFGRTVKPEEIKQLFRLRSSLPAEQRGNPEALQAEVEKMPEKEAERLRQVMAWQAKRDMPKWIAALGRATSWARQRSDTTDKVGVTGFCMGGGLTLGLAFSGADINAAAPFYGSNPALDQAGKVRCPLLLMYGRNDPFIMPGVPALLKSVEEAHLTYGLHIYEDAGHAFLNDTRPEAYNAAAAKDAWHLTTDFFAKHLG